MCGPCSRAGHPPLDCHANGARPKSRTHRQGTHQPIHRYQGNIFSICLHQMTSAHESLRTILDAFHVLHRTPTCFSSSDPLDHESTIVCRGRLEALLAAGTVYDNARNTLVAFFTEFEQFVDDQLTDTSERILQRIGDRSHTMSTAMGTNGALIAHPDAGAVRVTAHSPDVDGQLELTCIADRLPLVCIAVAAGRHYSFFIDADGQLLCGGGRFGSPQLMQSLCGIQFVGVSTGWDWTTAVTLTGEVYTWYTMNVPILCGGGLTGQRVLSVASGWRHCIAVAEGGGVYSWGKNESSQCGYESAGNGTPRRIELLSSIHAMNASAGCLHSLVVSDTGSVFAFGDNRFGQLGHVHQNHRGCQLPRRCACIEHRSWRSPLARPLCERKSLLVGLQQPRSTWKLLSIGYQCARAITISMRFDANQRIRYGSYCSDGAAIAPYFTYCSWRRVELCGR